MYLVTFLTPTSLFVILFQHDYFGTAASLKYIHRKTKKQTAHLIHVALLCYWYVMEVSDHMKIYDTQILCRSIVISIDFKGFWMHFYPYILDV